MLKALEVHTYMMEWLDHNDAIYSEAISEMDRRFPGWFERDGDVWIIQWIEMNTRAF